MFLHFFVVVVVSIFSFSLCCCCCCWLWCVFVPCFPIVPTNNNKNKNRKKPIARKQWKRQKTKQNCVLPPALKLIIKILCVFGQSYNLPRKKNNKHFDRCGHCVAVCVGDEINGCVCVCVSPQSRAAQWSLSNTNIFR